MRTRTLAWIAATSLAATSVAATPVAAADCAANNPLSASYVSAWAAKYHATKYQVTVYDVRRDCTFAVSTYSGTFPTASTVKVMIAVQTLQRVADGQTSYSSVSGSLKSMITVSSNTSAQRLYRKMGGAAGIRKVAKRYGLTRTAPGRKWGVTKTTASDQVLLLRRAVLEPSTRLPATQRRTLVRLMRQVTPEQRWGAGKGLPTGWRAAVKNGWYHTVAGDEGPVNRSRVNTMGIVWDDAGQPRYVIAAFSNRWRTDAAGMRAWNAMSRHVAGVLSD